MCDCCSPLFSRQGAGRVLCQWKHLQGTSEAFLHQKPKIKWVDDAAGSPLMSLNWSSEKYLKKQESSFETRHASKHRQCIIKLLSLSFFVIVPFLSLDIRPQDSRVQLLPEAAHLPAVHHQSNDRQPWPGLQQQPHRHATKHSKWQQQMVCLLREMWILSHKHLLTRCTTNR